MPEERTGQIYWAGQVSSGSMPVRGERKAGKGEGEREGVVYGRKGSPGDRKKFFMRIGPTHKTMKKKQQGGCVNIQVVGRRNDAKERKKKKYYGRGPSYGRDSSERKTKGAILMGLESQTIFQMQREGGGLLVEGEMAGWTPTKLRKVAAGQ